MRRASAFDARAPESAFGGGSSLGGGGMHGLDPTQMPQHHHHLPEQFPRVSQHVFAMSARLQVGDKLALTFDAPPLLGNQLASSFETTFEIGIFGHHGLTTPQSRMSSKLFDAALA